MICLVECIGTGRLGNEFQPVCGFQPGMSCIDLRPDPTSVQGYYLVDLPVPVIDQRVSAIATVADEVLGTTAKQVIGSKLSLTLDALTFPLMAKELLHDRQFCGAPLAVNPRTSQMEIVFGRLGVIWSEPAVPVKHSKSYDEDWRSTGTDVTLAQKFNAVYSVAWANISEQFGSGGSGTPTISSATPNRLTNAHVTNNMQVMTAVSAITDTDDNEISMSARIVTSGTNIGIFSLARFNSAGHTGYLTVWDRSGSLRNRASYASSGALNTLDDSGTDPGSGTQGIGVSCSGSTISWTRPGTDYSTTDTHVTTGRYGGLFLSTNATSVTAETYGDLIWRDVAGAAASFFGGSGMLSDHWNRVVRV